MHNLICLEKKLQAFLWFLIFINVSLIITQKNINLLRQIVTGLLSAQGDWNMYYVVPTYRSKQWRALPQCVLEVHLNPYLDNKRCINTVGRGGGEEEEEENQKQQQAFFIICIQQMRTSSTNRQLFICRAAAFHLHLSSAVTTHSSLT